MNRLVRKQMNFDTKPVFAVQLHSPVLFSYNMREDAVVLRRQWHLATP